MTIEFNGLNSSRSTANRANNTPLPEEKGVDLNSTPAASQASDKVEISDRGARLQRLEETILNAAPVDLERVQAIKEAIQEGRFEINTEQLAQKLVDFESEL